MNSASLAGLAGSFVVVGCFVGACGNSPPPGPTPTPTVTAPPVVVDAAAAVAIADAEAPIDASPMPSEIDVAITVLAKNQHASAALAADGSHVYWVEDVEGSVTRVPKRGGAIMMFYSSPAGGFMSPSTIAFDEKEVFWTEHVRQDSPGAAGAVLGSVMKLDKGGGKPTIVASGIRDELRSLAIDAKGVYWIAGSAIMRASKAGGGVGPLTLKLAEPTSVGADGKHVYWTQTGPAEKGNEGGTLLRQPPTPGAKAETLASGLDKPTSVLVDDAGVCWVTSGTKISCMGKKAPFTSKVVGESTGGIADVTHDEKFVYWLGAGDGTVMRAARDGSGPAEKLASGQTTPVGIAVDKTNVYWSTKGTEAKQFRDGTVVLRAKP